MAYTVTFGSIYKRVNSTYNTYTAAFTASCAMKEPCDLLNPVFTLQLSNPGLMHNNINYMEVAELGRFYWITAMTFVLGHWEITGKVDVMGTYKTDIGAHPQYIARSSQYFARDIPDPLLLAFNTPKITKLSKAMGLSTSGSFIVCCAGTSSNKFYSLSQNAWQALYGAVFTSGFLQDYYTIWDAVVQDVTNEIFKPEDYILSAKWVPAVPTGTQEEIRLGFTATGVYGGIVTPGMLLYSEGFVWNVPQHPQAATYGTFLNGNAYRKITLALPGYGNIVLDADALAANDELTVSAGMDVTGCLCYSVDYAGHHTFLTCDLSTDAGFAAQKSSVGSAVSAIGQAANIAAMGGTFAAGIAGGISGIIGAIPQVERASSGGSRAALFGGATLELCVQWYEINTPPSNTLGRAYCQEATPASLGGYMQCSNASVPCKGTQPEIEEINNYMNGGFFYE